MSLPAKLESRQKTRLRKGDEVVVISGKDKGKKGGILKVLDKGRRVLVERVNMVKRHTKPKNESEGGIIDKESSIDISNVMLMDPTSSGVTRIGMRNLEDGRKVRFAKASSEIIDS